MKKAVFAFALFTLFAGGFSIYKVAFAETLTPQITHIEGLTRITAPSPPFDPEVGHINEPVNKKASEKPKPAYVKVEKGDTLTKIADQHDTTYKRLFEANKKIKHPDLIKPGEKIRIPEDNEKLAKRELPWPEPKTPVSPAVPAMAVETRAPAVASGSVWDRLAQCESGGNWSINTGNGYYGGLQFTLSTWRSVGGKGYPHQNNRAEQIKRGTILQARSGWGQWPACTSKLGLR